MIIFKLISNKIFKGIFLLFFLTVSVNNAKSQYHIKWTHVIGAEYNSINYTLTKTAGNNWNNCGAISENQIRPNEDGKAVFVVESTDMVSAFGLSEYNIDPDLKSLDYAFQIRDDKLFIIQGGKIKGRYGNVDLNDILTIERSGNQILLSKNGSILVQYTIDPSVSLYIDVSIFKQGDTISGNLTTSAITELLVTSYLKSNLNCVTNEKGTIELQISGGTLPYKIEWSTGSVSQIIENLDPGIYTVVISDYIGQKIKYEIEILKDIEWKNLTGCTENSDGTIIKTVPKPWGNSGGLSYNGINIKESGSIQLTVQNYDSERAFGFSTYNSMNHYEEIDYCYFISRIYISIFEKGKYIGEFGKVQSGDILKIVKKEGIIYYLLNGKEIRKTAIKNEEVLFVDFAIYNENGMLEKIESDFCFPEILLNYTTEANPTEYCLVTTTLNPYGGYPPFIYQWEDGNTSQVRDLSPGIYNVNISDNYEHLNKFSIDALTNVEWTDFVGTEIQGDHLVKIVEGDWGTGGATSTNSMTAGENGYFSYTINTLAGERAIGLSTINSDAHFETIDFCFFIKDGGGLFIFQKGKFIGEFGKVIIGDVIGIEKRGTGIIYKVNNKSVYETKTEQPLSFIIDAALIKINTYIGPVYASFCEKPEIIADYTTQINEDCKTGSIYLTVSGGIPPFTYKWSSGETTQNLENVKIGVYTVTITDYIHQQKAVSIPLFPELIWTDLVGVEVRNDSLIKIVEGDWGTGGAASENILLADQNGYVAYRVNEPNIKAFGLSAFNENAHFSSIDFCFMVSEKGYEIWENGKYFGNYGKYSEGDVLKIEKRDREILYWLNEKHIKSSEIKNPDNFVADVALVRQGSYFRELYLSFCLNTIGISINVTTQSCSMTSEGQALVNVNGGTVPYSYSWESTYFNIHRDSIFDTTIEGFHDFLPPGFYNIIVNDSQDSSSEAIFKIPEEILWKYSNGIELNNNSIVKVTESGWESGVLNSYNGLNINKDGAFEIEIIDLSTKFSMGFRDTMIRNNNGLTGIFAGVIFDNGVLSAYENGTIVNEIGICNIGDIICVQRRDDDIYYLVNNVIIRNITISAFSHKPLSLQIGIFNSGGRIALPIFIPVDPIPFYPVFNIYTDMMNCGRFNPPNGYISVTKTGGFFYNSYNYEFVLIEDGVETVVQSSASNSIVLHNPGLYSIRITAHPLFGHHTLSREYKRFIGVYPEYSDDIGTYLNYNYSNNYIEKIGTTGDPNSGFSSINYNELDIYQNGWIGFTVKQLGVKKAIGFSTIAGEIINNIDYAFVLNGNTLEIRENGLVAYTGSVSINDRLQVSRNGYSIKYWQNELLLREVTTDPNVKLIVDGSLYMHGSFFDDIISSFCIEKCDYQISHDLSDDSEIMYTACENQAVPLNITLINGGSLPVTFSWIPTTGLSCTDCYNPTITVSNSTTYTLVAYFNGKCHSYLQIHIEIEECQPEDDDGFTFNNYGAQMIINAGYSINVYGSIYNDDGGINYSSSPYTNFGRWYNEGLIRFSKNWTNNSIKYMFRDIGTYITKGDVELIGGFQKIQGNTPTLFNNLILLEYGKKVQYIDAGVKGVLNLIDSELDVRDNTVYINNNDRASVLWNTGYIVTHTAPSLYGWIERDVNFNFFSTANDYDFPVAAYDMSMNLKYRPVNAIIFGANKHMRVRCVNSDPNMIIPNGNNKAANISLINDKYYHQIEETESHNPVIIPSNAIIKIFYDETEDGHFQSISHFDDQPTTYPSSVYPPITVPVWKCADFLTWNNAVLPEIYSSVQASFWTDYSSNEFALSQAGIFIDTDDYGDNGSGFSISGPYDNGEPYDSLIDNGTNYFTGDDVIIVPEEIPGTGTSDHYIINVNAGEENTGSFVNIDINNSMTIEDISVEIDNVNYSLSSDLYEVVDGSILILHSDPQPFGPECNNDFNIELRDGLTLTPNSLDGLFTEFSITGIADYTYVELEIFNNDGITVYSESGINISNNKWDGKVDIGGGVYEVVEGIYNFKLIFDTTTILEGQFIVKN